MHTKPLQFMYRESCRHFLYKRVIELTIRQNACRAKQMNTNEPATLNIQYLTKWKDWDIEFRQINK